ncbi:MAG TPA: hypothetical protein VGI27_03255, partial [Solirubrobacteraceae bacterium]
MAVTERGLAANAAGDIAVHERTPAMRHAALLADDQPGSLSVHRNAPSPLLRLGAIITVRGLRDCPERTQLLARATDTLRVEKYDACATCRDAALKLASSASARRCVARSTALATTEWKPRRSAIATTIAA